HASTRPCSSAARPSACCSARISTSVLDSPSCCRLRSRNRKGSVPLVAATFLPLRSFTDWMGESLGTTRAVHSGRENTYTLLIGLPLAFDSTAARPAVEPKSTLPLLRNSSARLLPW